MDIPVRERCEIFFIGDLRFAGDPGKPRRPGGGSGVGALSIPSSRWLFGWQRTFINKLTAPHDDFAFVHCQTSGFASRATASESSEKHCLRLFCGTAL